MPLEVGMDEARGERATKPFSAPALAFSVLKGQICGALKCGEFNLLKCYRAPHEAGEHCYAVVPAAEAALHGWSRKS